MKALDDLGHPWLVLPGDPAWELVKGLKGEVVLPISTLVRAIVPHPDRVTEHLRKLETAYQVTGDEDIKVAYLRAVALHSCLSRCYTEAGGS